jgi:hypothetical protein
MRVDAARRSIKELQREIENGHLDDQKRIRLEEVIEKQQKTIDKYS